MTRLKTSPFLALAVVAALGMGLAGCGSNGDNDTADAPTTVEPPTMPEPAPPTDLEKAQDAAKMAAAAAKTAADNAATADSGAAAATENLATDQTGAMARSEASKAQDYANKAMMAYEAAKAASDAAAAATDTAAAIRAQIDAESAQDDAEAAAMKAGEYSEMAIASAMGELKIDGTMKSVGETTINAGAPRSEVTSGSGKAEQKTITGLINEPMTTGGTTNGRSSVDAVIDTDPPTKYVSPMVNAAMRDNLKIGKVVDSADDTARLQIMTGYASTRAVKVYASDGGADWQSNKAGTVVINSDGTADDDGVPEGTGDTADVVATLRPVGMFYMAGDTSDNTITATSPQADGTQQGDTVAASAKAKQVYSFVNGSTTVYVVLEDTAATTAAGETTTAYDYSEVGIHVAVNRDGIGVTDGAGDESVFVTAALPAAKSYSHLHFGVWAGLGDAAKDGNQEIADLGIGFVQSIGDGLTGADMQNAGSATYKGNWAAAVQEAHPDGEGTINLLHGDATLTADFDKADITAALSGLATLKGDISGNTFSGKAASGINAMHGLDSEASFSGTFNGGFYGAKNAEAGGIFDFSADEGGAFRGAFGGAKQPTN